MDRIRIRILRTCVAGLFCLITLAGQSAAAAQLSFEELLKDNPTLPKPDGKLVRFSLAPAVKDKGTNRGAQVFFKTALPAKLGADKAGEYLLTLRVKLDPVDACSDRFKIQVGDAQKLYLGTDGPDPADSDYRLWKLRFSTNGKDAPALTVGVEQQQYQKEPRFAAIGFDSCSVERRGVAAAISSVRTSKVLYDPNEDIACTAKVHNYTDNPVKVELRATEISDLAKSREVGRQSVELKPNADEQAVFKWNAGADEYGREVRIELLDGGAVTDSASDYFNVADNVWKVAIEAFYAGLHMTNPDSVHCSAKTDEQLIKSVDDSREMYGNFHEHFAWSPDDAFYMTPTAETWISGQGAYQHTRSRVLLLCKREIENGIWPITYAKSAASGPPCFEYIRKNPEYGYLGRLQSQFDEQFERDWNKQVPGNEKTIFYTWMSLVIDITNPKLVDHCINEILDSAQMFGWRGARYDDHYTLWGKPYDELSTKNMERIFELGKQRSPKFVWGFNWLTMGCKWVWPDNPAPAKPWKTDTSPIPDPTPPQWAKDPDYPGEFLSACKNGGYIMNEEARGASNGTFTNYARLVNHEARVVRKLGGHYGPIPFDAGGVSAFNRYFPEILRAASRAHTYGGMVDRTFAQFMTRFSAYIYGAGLTPIDDPEAAFKVEATGGVWWRMFAYTCQQGATKRAVIHLLSAPAKDKIADNFTGAAQRIRSATVTYTGPEKVTHAWELSPFIDGFEHELTPAGNSVKPPDFYFWKTIVFDLEQK